MQRPLAPMCGDWGATLCPLLTGPRARIALHMPRMTWICPDLTREEGAASLEPPHWSASPEPASEPAWTGRPGQADVHKATLPAETARLAS